MPKTKINTSKTSTPYSREHFITKLRAWEGATLARQIETEKEVKCLKQFLKIHKKEFKIKEFEEVYNKIGNYIIYDCLRIFLK